MLILNVPSHWKTFRRRSQIHHSLLRLSHVGPRSRDIESVSSMISKSGL